MVSEESEVNSGRECLKKQSREGLFFGGRSAVVQDLPGKNLEMFRKMDSRKRLSWRSVFRLILPQMCITKITGDPKYPCLLFSDDIKLLDIESSGAIQKDLIVYL